jgi:hypothetical protein
MNKRDQTLWKHAKRNFYAILLLAAFLPLSCATSEGVNRHQIGSETPKFKLPITIVATAESGNVVSAGKRLAKGDTTPFFLMFGLGGMAAKPIAGSDKFGNIVRGGFAAGQAFQETVRKISGVADVQSDRSITLDLTRFQHFWGANRNLGWPGIVVAMEFTANMRDSGKTVGSFYRIEWERKGSFFPGEEKDILRELLENALFHWCQQIQDAYRDSKSREKVFNDFPARKTGEFSVGPAEYTYDIFGRGE